MMCAYATGRVWRSRQRAALWSQFSLSTFTRVSRLCTASAFTHGAISPALGGVSCLLAPAGHWTRQHLLLRTFAQQRGLRSPAPPPTCRTITARAACMPGCHLTTVTTNKALCYSNKTAVLQQESLGTFCCMLFESWEDGVARQQKKEGKKKLSGESLGFNCIEEKVNNC